MRSILLLVWLVVLVAWLSAVTSWGQASGNDITITWQGTTNDNISIGANNFDDGTANLGAPMKQMVSASFPVVFQLFNNDEAAAGTTVYCRYTISGTGTTVLHDFGWNPTALGTRDFTMTVPQAGLFQEHVFKLSNTVILGLSHNGSPGFAQGVPINATSTLTVDVFLDAGRTQQIGVGSATVTHAGSGDFQTGVDNDTGIISGGDGELRVPVDLGSAPEPEPETPSFYTVTVTNYDITGTHTLALRVASTNKPIPPLNAGQDDIVTPGSNQGRVTKHFFQSTSVGDPGDEHEKVIEVLVNGNVIYTFETPVFLGEYDELGNLLGANAIDRSISIVIWERDDSEDPDDPDEDDIPNNPNGEPDNWTPPEPDTPGGPAGDTGNPGIDDMSKADFYDSSRKAFEDAGSDFDSPPNGSTQSIFGGVSDDTGSDEAGEKGKRVIDEIGDVVDGLGNALPAVPQLPTATGTHPLIWSVSLPTLGALSIDASGYSSYITLMRNILLLILGVVTFVLFVRMIREASAK